MDGYQFLYNCSHPRFRRGSVRTPTYTYTYGYTWLSILFSTFTSEKLAKNFPSNYRRSLSGYSTISQGREKIGQQEGTTSSVKLTDLPTYTLIRAELVRDI